MWSQSRDHFIHYGVTLAFTPLHYAVSDSSSQSIPGIQDITLYVWYYGGEPTIVRRANELRTSAHLTQLL